MPKSSFQKLMQQSKDSIKPKNGNGFAKPIPEGLKKPKPPYKNTLRSVTFDKYGGQANERMMSTRQMYQEFDDWGGRGVSKEFLLKEKPYFEHVRERREQNELLRSLAKKHGASSDVYRETLKRVEEDNRGVKEKPKKPRLDEEGPGGEDPHIETVLRFGDRVRDQNMPSIVYHLRKHPKLILSPVVTLAATKYAPEMKVTVFEHAVRHGNLRLATKLQRFHPPVDSRDACGFQPMHYACCNSDYEMVECLQSLGAKLDAKDGKGNPHIGIVAREGRGRGKLRILEFMLKSNIDMDAVDLESGSSALMHSVRRLDLHSAQLLLEYGARQFPDNNGIAPLELAILCGNLELLLMLIEHQPEVLQDSYAFGQSALHLAAGREDDLLEPKAATSGDQTQIILAKYPPLLNSQDREGNTPLQAAVRQGNLAAVKWLVGSGADMELQNNEHMTAVQLAAVHESSVHKEILFFLRHECGADTKFFEADPGMLERMKALDSSGKIFREKLGKLTDMVTTPAQDGSLDVLVRHGAYGRALVARRRALNELSQEVEEEFHSRGGYNDPALNEQARASSADPLVSTSPIKPVDGGFKRPGSQAKGSSHRRRAGKAGSTLLGMSAYAISPEQPGQGRSLGANDRSPSRSGTAARNEDDDDQSTHGNVSIGSNHSAHFLTGGASTTKVHEESRKPKVSPVKAQRQAQRGTRSGISPFRATDKFASGEDSALDRLNLGPARSRTNPEAIRKRRGGGEERGGANATAAALGGTWVPGGARPLSPAPGQRAAPVPALAPSPDLSLEVGFAPGSSNGPGSLGHGRGRRGDDDEDDEEAGSHEIDLRCASPDFGRRNRPPGRINVPRPTGFAGLQTESRRVWTSRPSIKESRAISHLRVNLRPSTTNAVPSAAMGGNNARSRPASRLSSAPGTGASGVSPVKQAPRHGDWGDSRMPPTPTRFPDFHIVAEFKRRSGVRTTEKEGAQLVRFERDYGPRTQSAAVTRRS